MQVKKIGKTVYGATLTAVEKKAMDMEIQRQLMEYTNKHMLEFDAMVLLVLHEQFGFGPKRLKSFYNGFAPEIDALLKRYEMGDTDQLWLCTHKLKEYGIDIEQWYHERLGN